MMLRWFRILNFLILFSKNLKNQAIPWTIVLFLLSFLTSLLITGASLSKSLHEIFEKQVLGKLPLQQIQIKTYADPLKWSIPKQLIQEIENWKEVKEVTALSQSRFPITTFLSFKSFESRNLSFSVEIPLTGIPKELGEVFLKDYENPSLQNDFPNGFQEESGLLPVLLPKSLESLFKHFLSSHEFSQVQVYDLLPFIQIRFQMNHSLFSFLSKKIQQKNRFNKGFNQDSNQEFIPGKILGFAHLDLSQGFFIPQKSLERIQSEILNSKTEGYQILLISLQTGETLDTLKPKLEKIITEYPLELAEDSLLEEGKLWIDRGLSAFDFSLSLLGFFLILSCSVGIFYAFAYRLILREKELNLYRFFGASQKELFLLLILESLWLGISTGVLGSLLSFLWIEYLSHVLQNFVPDSLKSLVFSKKNRIELYFDWSSVFRLSWIVLLIYFASSCIALLRFRKKKL